MAKLTEEMKDFVKGKWAFVATINPEGLPNLGPKASFTVFDDEHIGWKESTGKHTYENLKENPNVAVVVADREKRQGYRFLGKAQLISEGPLYETAKEDNVRLGRRAPFAVVYITVDEIYDVGDARRGTKLV